MIWTEFKKYTFSLNTWKQVVPINPSSKIYKKRILQRVRMFRIFFLYLVLVNTQNEIDIKIISESPAIKKIRQTTPLVTQQKLDM